MLNFVKTFNMVVFCLLTLIYLYQVVYAGIGFFTRNRVDSYVPKKLHKYAAVISARNESAVIGELLRTLRAQDYPTELLDLYVIADNCTDNTAEIAEAAGAHVLVRNDTEHIGKGYALNFFFQNLTESYDGFFVFDADNLVEPDFVTEMNKVFDRGYQAVTSYRNSKNYASNWITAGYSLWFLREARFLNHPRMLLGTNCAVSGTGFLVSNELIQKHHGWPFHLLTEDIQFSVVCAIAGDRIGYCDRARLYDEQPVSFKQSWTQRLRWSKGFYQVIARYGGALSRNMFHCCWNAFSCYDMLMTVAPSIFLTLLCVVFNLFMLLAFGSEPTFLATRIVNITIQSLWNTLINFYLILFSYGLLTVISEWKEIRAKPIHKILYLFTFPLFLFTYIPISLVALVQKVEWKPIEHTVTKRIEDI